MAQNLYITATEAKSGKSAVMLGMMQLLLKNVRTVAIFRPIIAEPCPSGERDNDISLALTHFDLDIPYKDTYAFTFNEARNLINDGKHAEMLEIILQKYRALESRYDFVLCEGSDYTGVDAAFEFDLNTDIAANLSAPVMLVANAIGKSRREIIDSTQSTLDLIDEKGLNVVACIVNRSTVKAGDEKVIASSLIARSNSPEMITFVVPEEQTLGKPTMADVTKGLGAEVLYGQSRLHFQVENYIIAAMQVGNFLDYLEPGTLVVTPGDRSDIVLTSLGTRYSSFYPDISGIILTGGLDLPETVHMLIKGWRSVPVPILSVQQNTYRTMQTIESLTVSIEPGDTRKANTAIGHFESNVDSQELTRRIIDHMPTKITPKMFEFKLLERAASDRVRIVLPEGLEERILRATDILLQRKVVDIILVGDPEAVEAKKVSLGLTFEAPVVRPETYPKLERYVETYHTLRKSKGISMEQARDIIIDPNYFSTMMVYMGHADGMVSGSITTTAQTVRPAFEFIKAKPGVPLISSVFLMCLRDRVLVFGDCAVNTNPTAPELAGIAISSAETARIFGIEPIVAMLSYSTGKSGKGADVDKVIEATRIAQELAPDLTIEGPFQYDAAIDPRVAATKAPGSKVAGRATVFIFPDLNTGNNTYKAVQRSSDGVVAIGPVLQGLNRPVNDLSRGCTVSDIVNTVAITAVQAQAEKERLVFYE